VDPALLSVGAYDRFNYGDLLFPLMLDYAARGRPLDHFATRRADLRSRGGQLVRSLRDLETLICDAPSVPGLILGGGEVLGATWRQTLISLTPRPADLALRLAFKPAPKARIDRLVERLFGSTWPTPYLPDPATAGAIRVATNAVGASTLDALPKDLLLDVLTSLRSCAYVSVRDHRSVSVMNAHGIRAELAPDSAAGMEVCVDIQPMDTGLVFQCSEDWARFRLDQVIDELAGLSSRFDQVSLVTIGAAGGHSDQVPLRKVAHALSARGIRCIEYPSSDVTEIASIIAGARVFVGSSLHGAITSMAYATPHVSLDRVGKLTAYMTAWGQGLTPFDVPPTALMAAVETASRVSRHALNERSEYLRDLALANTSRVLEAVAT
jgi:Polysaccharide pyruvyl transferase